MNFSWSTPLRRNGQTDLPLIPNEIYLHIFECIAPADQPLKKQDVEPFSALALVCRFFRSVALPRIFEHVTFSEYTVDGNSNLVSRARKTKWATQILANAEPAKSLALYVKVFTFECWETVDAKWLFPFACLYCKAMMRMSNLQKVVFFASFVKTEHWQALAELKLDVLEFHFCSFIDDPPDKQLTVRSVTLYHSWTTFILRPIATTFLRFLSSDDVKSVMKIVAFRQLAIDDLVLDEELYDSEPPLDVFRHLPSVQNVTFDLSILALDSLYGKLSLTRLFTRLRSFTMNVIDAHLPPHAHDYVKMLVCSNLCDGPGTLPSLEELTISLSPLDELAKSTLNIIYDCLNETVLPAFPNVRCIKTDDGFMSLEEGNWKLVHYSY